MKIIIKWSKTFTAFGLLVLLAASAVYCQENSVGNITDETLVQAGIIADEYYKQREIAIRKHEIGLERSWHRDRKTSAPIKEAEGIVLNIRGEPVEDSVVAISVGYPPNPLILGTGKTDKNGVFRIPLSQGYPVVNMEVKKDKYRRMGRGSISEINGYEVRLGREINESFLKELIAEKNIHEQIWLLLEIIGTNDSDPAFNDDNIVFPYLGALRPLMLKILESKMFEQKDADKYSLLRSPADRSRSYLFLWQDPADQNLFKEVGSLEYTIHLVENVSASTIDDVCTLWADVHFKKEKVLDYPSPFPCPERVLDPEEQHALVDFNVSYEHFGYSMKLILLKEGDMWTLKAVQDTENWDAF
ncbi:MAG: hypothetical protein MIO92_08580 [Methanosarcinaceae archaeon]|nr:hypothetical protein [Methanosarcinaceae archaeon]